MIDISEIEFERSCQYDDTGRVFYAQGRVFRAIFEEAEDMVLNFLNSELCHYLMSNKMLVSTRISEEVVIPGYPLVLEHDVVFCSRPIDWSFEMSREVAIAAISLIEISLTFGYYVADPYPWNFAIDNGKIAYYDFGSFRKGITSMPYEWLATTHYLPLLIKSFYGARFVMSYKSILPSDYSNFYVRLLKKLISRYEIYHHLESLHFVTRFKVFYDLSRWINDVARKYFPQKVGAKTLLKHRIVYKKLNRKDFIRIRNPYEKITNILPIEDSSIIRCAAKLKRELGLTFRTVLCVGNYDFESLFELQAEVEKRVILMTHDSVYVDDLFKKLIRFPSKINLISGNLVQFHTNDGDVKRDIYGGELVIIQEQLDILSKALHYPSPCDIPPFTKYAILEAIFSYCHKCLLVPSEIETDYINLIEKSFRKEYHMHCNGKKYVLYKKMGHLRSTEVLRAKSRYL